VHRRELLKKMADVAVAATPRLDHSAINSNERTREVISYRIVKLEPPAIPGIEFLLRWIGWVA